jgi:hypothetical protein
MRIWKRRRPSERKPHVVPAQLKPFMIGEWFKEYIKFNYGPLLDNYFCWGDSCVKESGAANHAPVVKLNHPGNIIAKPGEVVNLSGTAKDPDSNKLSYKWWQYSEAETLKESLMLNNSDSPYASVIIPSQAEKGKILVILSFFK